MMSDEIIGMSLDELRKWDKESILDLLGIEVGPVRIKSALLPLKALKAAVWGLADEDADE
jgi:nitrogen fixation NifU-like protein